MDSTAVIGDLVEQAAVCFTTNAVCAVCTGTMEACMYADTCILGAAAKCGMLLKSQATVIVSWSIAVRSPLTMRGHSGLTLMAVVDVCRVTQCVRFGPAPVALL